MTKVRIFVTYKQSVFDPQGETIKDAIHTLGHDEVKDVQVGKFFDVTAEGTGKAVANTSEEISDQLLVNFNMKTYKYKMMAED